MLRSFTTCSILASLAALVSGCGDETAAAPRAASEAPAAKSCCPADPEAAPRTQETAPRADIPDVELIDQDGKRHRFYTDLVKGKVVLVNAMFTKCTGTCPAQASVFAGVQHHLRDRAGEDVRLISISLDPLADTPERLKEFADRFSRHRGWTLLTGRREDTRAVLESLDLYAANPEEHTPMCVIGNEPAGVWMKAINLCSAADLAGKVRKVAEMTAPPLARSR
jgi:protein SCO1/2